MLLSPRTNSIYKQESLLVAVRLHYSASSLPRAWAWPRPQQGSVGDQGWCGGSSVLAALETAAARSVDNISDWILLLIVMCVFAGCPS